MNSILRFVPLEKPPEFVSAGIGVHGQNPRESYFIEGLWCLHLFRDPLDLKVDGQRFEVLPGCATIMPPSVPIEYFFPRPCVHLHLSVMFRAAPNENRTPIPAIQNLGADFGRWFGAAEQLMAWRTAEPARAQARLWEILWHLARREPSLNGSDLAEQARELIEKRLHQPLFVAHIARELGVSHNHLTRRFREATGQTVVEYLQKRRVERAEELLRHTTMPIKAIAAQCGLGDFHSFNKAMRRVRGCSPRQIRKR